MPGPVTTQVSLDLTTIAEALEMARGARRAGIDWLEAGTPLILGEGLHAVEALRSEFETQIEEKEKEIRQKLAKAGLEDK